MSKSRIKAPVAVIQNREDMEALVGEIAMAKANEQRITAQLNEEITALRRNYEAQLGSIDTFIDEKMALARDWAEANPAEFGDKRSIAMTQGDVGWRIGQPTLKPLMKWSWDRVLERLTSLGKVGYVRTLMEVDKAAMLADRLALGEAGLATLGVRVHQDDKFYIEPRLIETETRVKEGA